MNTSNKLYKQPINRFSFKSEVNLVLYQSLGFPAVPTETIFKQKFPPKIKQIYNYCIHIHKQNTPEMQTMYASWHCNKLSMVFNSTDTRMQWVRFGWELNKQTFKCCYGVEFEYRIECNFFLFLFWKVMKYRTLYSLPILHFKTYFIIIIKIDRDDARCAGDIIVPRRMLNVVNYVTEILM